MLKDRIELYKKIEKERNSKLLVFVTGDRQNLETQISTEMQDYFVNHLDKFNLPKKLSLFLYTRGGDTMAAWSLINLIKQFCDEYEVIVPSKARSAGTLICLGANNIVMTKQATLGPIDPTLNSPLNPQNPTFPQNPQARIPVSVESIKGYFEYAKQELKIKNEKDLAKIFIGLSGMIHPTVIGNVFRSRSQIQMLGNKLLNEHFKDKKKINKIISFLCSDSGSHDYPIYRREARNDLGLKIETPSPEFYKTIKSVYDSIHTELELSNNYDPNVILGTNNTANYMFRRAIIESIEGGTDVFKSEGTVNRSQIPIQQGIPGIPGIPNLPGLQRIAIEDQRKFEGWRHE
ncbi:MAG: hypothetical protein MUE64_00065 [Ignavibacteriaceae bacterium]|jgi:hypothetical protein|nr:hypothetical protein [Ignavibacteriaceae bacterium]